MDYAKNCCIVITTTDNKKTAELIAKNLIQSKLAACVQIDNVHSFFCYKEELSSQKEWRLWIKAKNDNYGEIELSIKNNHNYQLPQIIKLDITDGLTNYLEWVYKN